MKNYNTHSEPTYSQIIRNPKLRRQATWVSLFTGLGGSSLGVKKAGFQELLAVEWNKSARDIYKLNFPDVPVEGWDISSISGAQLLERINLKPGELDYLETSPPCQDLSSANTKNFNPVSNRNSLFRKTLQLIGETQPKVFTIENVPGLLRKKNKSFLKKVIDDLSQLNYQWEIRVLKAEEFGVPQARRRVIIVGVRRDIFNWLRPIDLFPQPDLEHVKDMNLAKILPEVMAFSPGQFQDKVKLANLKPVCTITRTASLWFYDKDGKRRRPTIEELKKLFTFPDSFKFTGTFLQQWAGLGNCVPPELAFAVASHLKNNILTPDVLERFSSEESLAYAAQKSKLYTDWYSRYGIATETIAA